MTLRLRTAFLIVLALLVLCFLYFERAILTPFIAAAIFAYIFNPIVNFFTNKVKLPRVISVLIIYFILIFIISILIFFLARGILFESSELKSTIDSFLLNARYQIYSLPYWLQPLVNDTLRSISNFEFFKATSFLKIFPKAVSGLISAFIFLFSSFYFLKEGKGLINRALVFVPKDYRVDVEILLRRINTVLGGYLRGQIFMIFLISSILFIALSIIGVRFALIIAIFSGVAEIVPIIGPIVAAMVAVVAVLLGGTANFSLSPLQASIIVVVTYFVVRQIQDYFIIPHVMGRITKLPPLVILFAVLAGGHSGGVLGLILAVPIAGVIKILLEYFVDTINDRELHKKSLGR